MLKSVVELAIRGRLADIYEKLAIVTHGVADLSEKLIQVVDHIGENRKTLNVIIEMHTQLLESLAEEQHRSSKGGVPTLADLLSKPDDDDDDMPN